MQNSSNSLSQMIDKGIDYMTEEYIKQLIMDVTTNKLEMLRPYVGTIYYPSGQFNIADNFSPTVQFGGTLYVGYMDFLLPDAIVSLTGAMAYTKLTFNLDGLDRTFIQLTGGDNLAGGVKFSTFVQSLFPDANLEIPFNHSAIHIVKDFKIEGSEFNVVGTNFTPTGFTSGSHTPNFRFQVACSGYSALVL